MKKIATMAYKIENRRNTYGNQVDLTFLEFSKETAIYFCHVHHKDEEAKKS